jgi:hypothetical protein
MKTRIAGGSWCKLAQWMERWLARDTADYYGQQKEGTLIILNNNKTMSEDSRLPQPLLDGSQGKLSITIPPMEMQSTATGPGIKFSKGMIMEYGRPDECERKEDEQQI